MTKEQFRDRYGDEPRRDDLTILAPKQVRSFTGGVRRGLSFYGRSYLMALASLRQLQGSCIAHPDTRTPLLPQDDPTEQIFVFFPEEPKVGVKTIKVLAERMRAEAVQRALMVVASNMTPFAKQCLQEMQPKYVIELVCVGGVGGLGAGRGPREEGRGLVFCLCALMIVFTAVIHPHNE